LLHQLRCVRLRYTSVVAAEDWITLEQAAEKLHVALDTMRRWVRLGYFPRTKVGKRYLIPLKALDDFLQSRLEYGARPVTPRKKSPTRARKKAARKSSST
jgi:excisionase family DNA binding protein